MNQQERHNRAVVLAKYLGRDLAFARYQLQLRGTDRTKEESEAFVRITDAQGALDDLVSTLNLR